MALKNVASARWFGIGYVSQQITGIGEGRGQSQYYYINMPKTLAISLEF